MKMYKIIVMTCMCVFFNLGYAGDLPNQCKIAKNKGVENTNSYYNPRIKQVNDAIDEISRSGGDPDSIAVKINGKFMTLPEIRSKLKRDKNISLATVDQGISDCVSAVKPYQKVVDEFANISTGGLAKILPGKMGYIDASDILAGYPLGGKNALIPKARDDALNALGLGGNNDLGKIIKDPLRPIRCIFGC